MCSNELEPSRKTIPLNRSGEDNKTEFDLIQSRAGFVTTGEYQAYTASHLGVSHRGALYFR